MDGSGSYEAVRDKLAARIRELRKAQGLSQEKLAHEAGCHPTYVSMLERGKVNPSLKVLTRIADVLGVPVHQLVEP